MSKQRIRPSQIITTFGPGAIVDLPDDSVMIAGIEHWFEGHKPHTKISEPRLQAALKVNEFRTPPVGSYNDNDVPFVRFPRYRVCPKCSRLSDQFRWPKGDPSLPPVPRCETCNRETHPARLIVACPAGHIDDFPWYRWVHRGNNCGGGNLYLRGEGKSAGSSATCASNAPAASHVRSRERWTRIRWGMRRACRRRRPWLNDDDDPNDCNDGRTLLYVLQRVPRTSTSPSSEVPFPSRRGRTPSRQKSRHGGDSSRRRFPSKPGRPSSAPAFPALTRPAFGSALTG